jgi:hypothetical protein
LAASGGAWPTYVDERMTNMAKMKTTKTKATRAKSAKQATKTQEPKTKAVPPKQKAIRLTLMGFDHEVQKYVDVAADPAHLSLEFTLTSSLEEDYVPDRVEEFQHVNAETVSEVHFDSLERLVMFLCGFIHEAYHSGGDFELYLDGDAVGFPAAIGAMGNAMDRLADAEPRKVVRELLKEDAFMKKTRELLDWFPESCMG